MAPRPMRETLRSPSLMCFMMIAPCGYPGASWGRWRARRSSAGEAGAEAGLLPGVDVSVELLHGLAEPCKCVGSQDEHARCPGTADGGDDRLGAPGRVAGLAVVLCGVLVAAGPPPGGRGGRRLPWGGAGGPVNCVGGARAG